MDDLTIAQSIFTAFYAIFFGVFLSLVTKELNAFDTPTAWAIGFDWKNKPFWRFILSITFLNILPGIIFVYIFNSLSVLSNQKFLIHTWLYTFIIIMVCLTPHYIYRVYYSLIIGAWKFLYLQEGEYDKFRKRDEKAIQCLHDDRLAENNSHRNAWSHLFPALFMISLLFMLLGFFLVENYLLVNISLFICLVIIIIRAIKQIRDFLTDTVSRRRA